MKQTIIITVETDLEDGKVYRASESFDVRQIRGMEHPSVFILDTIKSLLEEKPMDTPDS